MGISEMDVLYGCCMNVSVWEVRGGGAGGERLVSYIIGFLRFYTAAYVTDT